MRNKESNTKKKDLNQIRGAAESSNFEQERIVSAMPPPISLTEEPVETVKEEEEEKALQKKKDSQSFADDGSPISPNEGNNNNNGNVLQASQKENRAHAAIQKKQDATGSGNDVNSPSGPKENFSTAFQKKESANAPVKQFTPYQPALQKQTDHESGTVEPFQLNKSASTKNTNNALPPDLQNKMEGAMGQDFSDVKIHKDSQQATDAGALAYAQGNDIHFAPGQFNPNTASGQKLIGHEFAHVKQQREGKVKPTKVQGKGVEVNDDPGLEKQADELGEKAEKGETTTNQVADGNGTSSPNNGPIQKVDDETETSSSQVLNETGYVIAPNGIRLHTTPSLEDQDVIDARVSSTGTPADNIYPQNLRVEVIGISGGWLYIRTPDQNQGWISDQFVDRSSEFEGAQVNLTGAVVADAGIRLQQIPARAETREGATLNLGTEITILKMGNERASSWSLIRTAEGRQGWIESVYIKSYLQIREEMETYLSENTVFEPDVTNMNPVLTGMRSSIQLKLPPRLFELIIRRVFRIEDITNELTFPSDAPRSVRPGFLRSVPGGWVDYVVFPFAGQYTYTVTITLQNIGTISFNRQFNAVSVQDRADDVLADQADLSFQDLTTNLNAQLGLLAPDNQPGDANQPHISSSGGNPAPESDPASPNHLRYSLRNPEEGVTYQWFVKPLDQNELPDTIGTHSKVNRENSSMYALGQGNSKSWPTSRGGIYVVICEPTENDGTQQPITFLQTILSQEQVTQVEGLQESLTKINNEYAPQLREQVPVTAVHVNESTGASTTLNLYLGHASDGNGYKMMDLTPGLDPSNVEIIYEGDSVTEVLADFDSNNKYPEGRISLRIAENDAGIARYTWNIETDGASFLSSLSSGFGWAALGLGVAGLLAAPFTGGSSLAVTALVIGSATAGVAAGALSIMDRLQNEELDTMGLTIDSLGIAADLLTLGIAGNGLRAGRQAVNVAGRNMRYLLYSNFVVEGASFTLISIQGIGQIQSVASSTSMSEDEKRAAIVRILAALAATGGLLMLSSRDLGTTNARLNGHISREILESISDEQRLILDLLDNDALARLRLASREDIDGLIRIISGNPTIAGRINNGVIPDDILASLARNQDAATMLRLRRLFGASIEDIDELVAATRRRLDARVDGKDNFELQYTDTELNNIISQGRTMGLSQDAIEDLIFTGSRNNKRLTSSQLIHQMDNWVNDIAPRGFPHLFNTLEEFNAFKQQITGLLENYGIRSSDIRIQGSALRTSSAGDIDIAVFLTAADFEAVTAAARRGIIDRTNPRNVSRILDPLDRQIADGRINSYYLDRIPGNQNSFNQDLYPIGQASGQGFSIDLSLMRSGAGFDMEPSLRF